MLVSLTHCPFNKLYVIILHCIWRYLNFFIAHGYNNGGIIVMQTTFERIRFINNFSTSVGTYTDSFSNSVICCIGQFGSTSTDYNSVLRHLLSYWGTAINCSHVRFPPFLTRWRLESFSRIFTRHSTWKLEKWRPTIWPVGFPRGRCVTN